MFSLVASLLVFSSVFTIIDSQISAMFTNGANQASNCAEWTNWGPCIWLKGKNPRWSRSYKEGQNSSNICKIINRISLNQKMLPGRTGCRHHIFFKLLRERWGVAFSNFYNYMRGVTLSEKQCGECSYQQSCGRQCHRREGGLEQINPLFVAERRCEGIDQNDACVSKSVADCKLWPNPNIQLPNVTESMLEIINGLDYLSCLPQKRHNETVCRCCCHPYKPNPETFKCELKSYLAQSKQPTLLFP